MPKRRPWLTQLYKIKHTEEGDPIDEGLSVLNKYIHDSADAGDMETIELFLKEVDLSRLHTAFVVNTCMYAWDVDVEKNKYLEFKRRVREELGTRPEMKGHVNALMNSLK